MIESITKFVTVSIQLILIGSSVLFSSLATSANNESQSLPIAIEGYSLVSYFTKGIAEKGSSEYSASSSDFVYHFTSVEQVALFKANPKKYKPKYKICPYSLARGMTLPLDPTNFKVIGDNLLLFHKSDAMDGLQLWNNAEESEEELFKLANKQYTLLKF